MIYAFIVTSWSTYKCLPHTSSHPLCWVDAHRVKAFPKFRARLGTTALLGPLIGHNPILGPGWRDPTATRVLQAMDGWWIRQTLICWVPIPYLTTIGCRSLAFFYCLPLNNTLALTNILFMNSLFFVCSFYFLCDATWWLAKLLLFSTIYLYLVSLVYNVISLDLK